MAKHFFNVKVGKVVKETNDCVSVEFDINEELQPLFQYKQGQNITILSHLDEIRRAYSICSSPLENKIKVAIKQVPGGVFSTFAVEKLKPGDELQIMQPAGSFFTELNPSNRKRYILFAAGSGITPVISILKTVLAVEKQSIVSLVYGNRNVQSVIFREELEALKDKYLDRFDITYILSREQTDSPLNSGRIDKEKCLQLAPVLKYETADEFFVCGPEAMIFTVRDHLIGIGTASENIHFELFTTPAMRENRQAKASVSDVSGEGSKVSVTVDGRTYDVNVPYEKVTILDAGLNQGINLPYSCKGGVCTTCRAKLLEGKVEMECNYGLEDYEVKQGYILTCQSHPCTEVVKVDFDQ